MTNVVSKNRRNYDMTYCNIVDFSNALFYW